MASNNPPAAPATTTTVVAPAAVPPVVPAHGPANWPKANSLTNLSGGERSMYRTKMQFLNIIHAIHLSFPDYKSPHLFPGDQWARIHTEYMVRRAALVAGPGYDHLPNPKAGTKSLRATYYHRKSEIGDIIAINYSRAGPPARSLLPEVPVPRHGGKRPYGQQRRLKLVGDGNVGSIMDGSDWEEDSTLRGEELEENDEAVFHGYDTSNNA